MKKDPEKPVDPKVGAYDKPEKEGGSRAIVIAVAVVLAILLLLWLFTDII